jgi:hypothetical protein
MAAHGPLHVSLPHPVCPLRRSTIRTVSSQQHEAGKSTRHHNSFTPKMARSNSGYAMRQERRSDNPDAPNELNTFTRLQSSDPTPSTPITTTPIALSPLMSITNEQENLAHDTSSTSAFSRYSVPHTHSPSDSAESLLVREHTRPSLRRRSTTASEKADVKRIYQHVRAGNALAVRKAEARFMERHQERDIRAWNRWGRKEAAKQFKESEAKRHKKRERKLGKGVVGWLKAKPFGVS